MEVIKIDPLESALLGQFAKSNLITVFWFFCWQKRWLLWGGGVQLERNVNFVLLAPITCRTLDHITFLLLAIFYFIAITCWMSKSPIKDLVVFIRMKRYDEGFLYVLIQNMFWWKTEEKENLLMFSIHA